jgi:Plasmid encoded RepA protein
MCTLPHSRPDGGVFKRRNGDLELKIVTDPEVGLPYGRYPRLLLSWVCTEAVRTRSAELHLGQSLSDFLRRLGLPVSGGKNGTIRRMRTQVDKLFSATIEVREQGHRSLETGGFRLSKSLRLWWSDNPDQLALWGSRVLLTEDFFRLISDRPIPLDLRALKALRSPLAIDLYAWLGFRLFVLNESGKSEARIPWEYLQDQFGANYGRSRAFKEKALQALKQALVFYPDAQTRVDDQQGALILKPCALPIPPKKARL